MAVGDTNVGSIMLCDLKKLFSASETFSLLQTMQDAAICEPFCIKILFSNELIVFRYYLVLRSTLKRSACGALSRTILD